MADPKVFPASVSAGLTSLGAGFNTIVDPIQQRRFWSISVVHPSDTTPIVVVLHIAQDLLGASLRLKCSADLPVGDALTALCRAMPFVRLQHETDGEGVLLPGICWLRADFFVESAGVGQETVRVAVGTIGQAFAYLSKAFPGRFQRAEYPSEISIPAFASPETGDADDWPAPVNVDPP